MEERFFKKAIILTGFGCNLHCIFCLQEKRTPAFFTKEKILKEILQRRQEGADWLILTGGEATIHPNFFDFIAFGKKIGYERIQVITNGRMFSSERFASIAAIAGLTEETVSFHGSTPQKHDALTRVPGSFEDAKKGVKNCNKYGIKLSFNTAINKLNSLDLGNIVKFIHNDLGFEHVDYDIIGTAPSGGAWKHKLLPKHDDVKQGIKQACEFGERNNIVIWVTRTPIQDMPKGYEYHKEPWEVITHDTLAMWDIIWREDRICDLLKCEFCEAGPFCFHLKNIVKNKNAGKLDYVQGKNMFPISKKWTKKFRVETLEEIKEVKKEGFIPFVRVVFDGLNNKWEEVVKKIEDFEKTGIDVELEFQINKKSIERIEDAKKYKVLFSPTNPYKYVKYSFETSNILHDTTDSLLPLCKIFELVKGPWINVPLCLKEGKSKEYWVNLDDFNKEGKPIPREVVNRMVEDVRVYPWECDKCSLKDNCPGFFGDYVKLFGFDKVFVR